MKPEGAPELCERRAGALRTAGAASTPRLQEPGALGGQPSAPAGRAARARSFCDPARGQRKVVPEVTARAQLGNHRFLEGIGAHCPSAFTFLSAKIPAGCRRSRGRAIQRGRGPARLRRGHELAGRVGPAHQTAPGAGESRPHTTNCVRPCVLVHSWWASFAPGAERGRGRGAGCARRGGAT